MAPKLTLVSRSLLFFHLVSLFLGSVNASFQDPDDNRTSINDLPNYTDSVKEAMITECKGGYSPNCLKLGLIRVISRSGSFSLPVLPGVSISSDGLRDSETPADEPGANLVAHPEKIDHLLLDRVSGYLGTLSLNMRVLEKNAPLSFAKSILGDGITATGRRKGGYRGPLLAAGLMAGGTTLAMGMAALAALAGKALMASLLALMLAAISALKGSGGGSEKTTYEIVAKPVVTHSTSHTSEVQHGHGGHYRRSMDIHPVVYSAHLPIER
ncbi:Protein of unknown function (DUF1676) [Nesidiocoris tenuis]|uniref:Osiris 16 n=1 Tax=Nesidiocoris tenuis TaxID=355587 RepID=A0ABN7AWF1_9HEMI|nr:Protein of unknown function (DUF1676) [Nesidiocoris tenuis]